MLRVGSQRTLQNGNPRNSEIVQAAVKRHQFPHCRPNSDSALLPIELKKYMINYYHRYAQMSTHVKFG